MLQAVVALLYFANKVLLSLNKKAGWQIGLLASVFAIAYFISIKVYLLVGLEFGFFSILVFGLLNHEQELKYEKALYSVMFVLLVFLYFVLKNSTFLEFLISVDFILAIYFLAKKNKILGWIVMLIGHLLMAYFTYYKQQYFFAIMQILSIGVAVYAILKTKNMELKKT
jgi:hypothetical protein